MSSRVVVAGVGMIPFAKPGASASYHEMGAEAARRALADAGIGYELVEQAYAGYVYGDSTAGQRAIYQLGMTGHSDRQRQQQLLDRLDRAVSGAPGDRQRRCRLRARARFRADEARRAGFGLHRPAEPVRGVRRARRQADRRARHSACAALFRRRRARPYEEIRNQDGRLRQDPRQGQPSCGEQSARDLPQGGDGRRGAERSGDLARRHDAADGLPADLRRRGRDPGLRDLRQAPRPQDGRRDRRAGDDHRHAEHLRHEGHDAARRLRHGARRREQGLRAVRHRARGDRRRRTARLLRPQRADHLRGARPVPARAAPRSSSTTATTPMAARSSPTRPAACCRRAIRSAPPALRSAPS